MPLKPRELHDMTVDELHARLTELSDQLFHLRLRRATAQLSNPMKGRETRRDVARVRTVLRERARRGGAAT